MKRPRVTRGRIVLAVAAILLVVLLLAAPLRDPLAVRLAERLQPPSAAHWLGTDQYGRDLLSRILAGTAPSLGVCLAATTIALTIGALLGGVAGFRGGWTDRALSLVIDSLTALPALLLALLIMAALGPSLTGVVIAVGIASAPSVARVVRGAVLSIREKDYVEASRLLGASESRTFLRHVLPNCFTPLAVIATMLAADALLIESALSFLGLGAPPPAATWGGLLADSREFMTTAAWLGLFPGLVLSAAVLAINLCGDALRDRMVARDR